jgi:integrase
MQQQIIACNESGFACSLEKMIATVPYEIHIKHEHYYHSLMLMWMQLFGFKIRAEEANNLGRSDIVWEQPGLTVVAEIKYDAKKKINTLLNEALKQIHARRYYNKYSGKILLLGVAFSGKQPGCRMEILNI